MLKICFVCTGNTCRSVMAERLMKKALKERGIADIKVSSKGLKANGETIAENAKIVLKKYKASGANRKSVKLGRIDDKTLYIVMTENMKSQVKTSCIMSIKDLTGSDVSDPYGGDVELYQTTANQIIQAIEILLEKILKWRDL